MMKTITHFFTSGFPGVMSPVKSTSGGARHSHALSAVLILLSLLMLVPGSARAEGDGDTSTDEVTFTYVSADPEGYTNEGADKLFDGDTGTKWCFSFSNPSYVIFKASKPGVVRGYTITTGNDSGKSGCTGRNPKSWTLYGSNDQQTWTVIDQVSDDSKLQDKNSTAYDYTCFPSDVYEYFKWEITSGSSSTMQMSEFKLDMMTVLCTEHHLEAVEAKEPTCVEVGNVEYYRCTACELLFKDDQAQERYRDQSYLLPAKGHHWENLVCTVCNSCAVKITEEDGKVTMGGFAEGVFIPNLVIPEKINDKPVKEIEGNAFAGTSLTSVSIPASVETIGTWAFYKCSSLSSVTFAADACLKNISFEAFTETGLTSVSIPASVETIDHFAFQNCYYLSSVTFAENGSLKTIGNSAFSEAPLASIVIPASVVDIGQFAFSGSKTLRSVSFAANGNLNYIGARAFYSTPLASINIPASVSHIGSEAFANAKYLESVTFNRAKGDDGIFKYFDSTTFDGDVNLKTIYVPWKSKEAYSTLLANQADKVKGLLDDEGIVYEVNDDTHELACIGTSQERMESIELKEVESMPVTEIREKAFKEKSWLHELVIPATVRKVDAQAFVGCENLQMVTMNTTGATIAADAFKDTPQLESILVSGDAYAGYKAQAFEQSDKLVAIYAGEKALKLTDEDGITDDMRTTPTYYEKGMLSYQRQGLTPGQYATFCLPFDINLSSSKDAFEKVYVPLSTVIRNKAKGTDDVDHFILMLEEKNTESAIIPANQPFLAKLSGQCSEIEFANDSFWTILDDQTDPQVQSMTVLDWDGSSGLMMQNDQIGFGCLSLYSAGSEAKEEDKCWTFNPDGSFGPQTSGKYIPFRLMLVVDDQSSGTEASAKQRVITIGVSDGSTTGIREIIGSGAAGSMDASSAANGSDTSSRAGIYDLNGRKVADGTQDMKHLRKGIYIQNGKKLVVK